MKLRISEDDHKVAYLELPKHPGSGTAGCVKKTVRVLDHIKDLNGADLYLDYNDLGEIIGIEILLD